MAVALSCPHCQTQLKLKSKHPTNKTARCPQCKGVVPLGVGAEERVGSLSRSPALPANGEAQPSAPETMTRSKPATTRAVGKSEVDFLAPPKRDDEIGRLGPYRVLSRIGSGGMGMVFRAEDPALKRQVALKVMLPHCALNPRRKARFLREAHAQAHVEHEHVVAIFQAGEVDGVAFIAMPLLKGQTLSSALSQNPRPPLREVLRIGREMAEGLAAAHEAGLIHRDIKPPNVWLDGKRRRVKILDFGLARSADSTDIGDSGEDSHPSGIQEDGALTVQGAVLGTPLYMSPEQARGEKADHRTDLFSLGIVLYQMTTGKLPFTGSCTSEILSAVKELQPLDPRALNPDVPQAVADFIMQLLAKPVAERPASAEEVAETLQRLEGALTSNDNDVVLPALALDDPWRDLDATEPSMLGEPLAPMPVAPRTLKAPRAWKRGSIFIIAGVATVLVGVLSPTAAGTGDNRGEGGSGGAQADTSQEGFCLARGSAA